MALYLLKKMNSQIYSPEKLQVQTALLGKYINCIRNNYTDLVQNPSENRGGNTSQLIFWFQNLYYYQN